LAPIAPIGDDVPVTTRDNLPASSDSQRECARATWCSASTRDPEGEWHPALTFQPFCPACTDAIVREAADLPRAYRMLAARVTDPVAPGSRSGIRMPPGSRVLIDATAEALMQTAAVIAGGWAARVRAVPQLTLSRNGFAHGTPEAVAEDCKVLARFPGPLLALQPGYMTREWTWAPGNPMPADLAADLADLEISNIGDGWVKAVTHLSGEDAGHEILALSRRITRHLGETPAPPAMLDGIPCRTCEEMALAVAELPVAERGDGDPEPPYSRCLCCRAELSRADHDAWVAMYQAWAQGAGILVCRRCDLGMHADCCWESCGCAADCHPDDITRHEAA
jgi:hypothetical protein